MPRVSICMSSFSLYTFIQRDSTFFLYLGNCPFFTFSSFVTLSRYLQFTNHNIDVQNIKIPKEIEYRS